ncbi:MAG: hypothetical protein KA138_10975 [Saprospiraceae bacterium]|jgi:hypothetical protein|nr:hypothetical protein [Saprospiraceae bacterium]
MEPTTAMIGTVVGYLAKKLKDNKSVQGFFDDFTKATVDWIRPIFLKDDGNPKDIIEDLKSDPDDNLNTDAIENAIAKALKKEPDLTQQLKAMYEQLQAKATTDKSINIINSKNVVTGTIHAGGSVTIGDNNNANPPK